MKIKKFRKLKDNRYKIYLENDEEYTLYDDIILKYDLVLTKEVTNQELDDILRENESLECYYKAIKYLANKNRSKKEIFNYLKRFNYEDSDINKALLLLEENHFLNEDSYIKSFIHDQILLTINGPGKIKRKLLELGLPEDKINDHLALVEESVWNDKLKKLVNKKIKSNKKDSQVKMKERILKTCIQNGYEKAKVTSLLTTIDFPSDEEALEKEINKLYLKLSRKYEGKELRYYLKNKLIAKGFNYKDIEASLQKLGV